MGMLSRLRARGEAFLARRLQGRAVSLRGRIPAPWPALFEFSLEAAAEPEPGGERLRLRAHSSLTVPGRALRTWIDIRGSTAALDEGSGALVPERLATLGVVPQRGQPVQTWAGAVEGPRPGFAVLTLMQVEKERLPPPLRRALGRTPLHLAATLAGVVEAS